MKPFGAIVVNGALLLAVICPESASNVTPTLFPLPVNYQAVYVPELTYKASDQATIAMWEGNQFADVTTGNMAINLGIGNSGIWAKNNIPSDATNFRVEIRFFGYFNDFRSYHPTIGVIIDKKSTIITDIGNIRRSQFKGFYMSQYLPMPSNSSSQYFRMNFADATGNSKSVNSFDSSMGCGKCFFYDVSAETKTAMMIEVIDNRLKLVINQGYTNSTEACASAIPVDGLNTIIASGEAVLGAAASSHFLNFTDYSLFVTEIAFYRLQKMDPTPIPDPGYIEPSLKLFPVWPPPAITTNVTFIPALSFKADTFDAWTDGSNWKNIVKQNNRIEFSAAQSLNTSTIVSKTLLPKTAINWRMEISFQLNDCVRQQADDWYFGVHLIQQGSTPIVYTFNNELSLNGILSHRGVSIVHYFNATSFVRLACVTKNSNCNFDDWPSCDPACTVADNSSQLMIVQSTQGLLTVLMKPDGQDTPSVCMSGVAVDKISDSHIVNGVAAVAISVPVVSDGIAASCKISVSQLKFFEIKDKPDPEPTSTSATTPKFVTTTKTSAVTTANKNETNSRLGGLTGGSSSGGSASSLTSGFPSIREVVEKMLIGLLKDFPPLPSPQYTSNSSVDDLVHQCKEIAAINRSPPSVLTGLPTYISVVFSVDRLVNLDDVAETIAVSGTLLTKWAISSCANKNKTAKSEDRVVVHDINEVWHPKFEFRNGAEDITMESDIFKDRMEIYVRPKNSSERDMFFSWKRKGIFTASCYLDLSLFPYDIQRCGFTFMLVENSDLLVLLNETLQMRISAPNLSDGLFSVGSSWTVTNNSFISEIVQVDDSPDRYSQVTFYLELRRRPQFYINGLLGPVLVLVTLELVAFMIPPGNSDRLCFSVYLVLAIAVNQSRILPSIPKKSGVVLLNLYIQLLMLFSVGCTVYAIAIFWLVNFQAKLAKRQVQVFRKHVMTLPRLLDLVVFVIALLIFFLINLCAVGFGGGFYSE